MEDTYKKVIGERLKTLKRMKGWTAEIAANKIGVSRSRYLNWESGLRAPKVDMFPVIAKAFNVDPSYIAGWTDDFDAEKAHYITLNKNELNSIACSDISFNESMLTQAGLKPDSAVTVKINDNSMTPQLAKDDICLLDLSVKQINGTDIYAIKTQSGDVLIRWIRKELNGTLTIYANEKTHFPAQQLTQDEFEQLDIIGRFVWSGRFRKND